MHTIISPAAAARTDVVAVAIPNRHSRRRRAIARLVPGTLIAMLAALALPAMSQAYPYPDPPEVNATITAPVNGVHGLYGDFDELAFRFEANAVSSPSQYGCCTYKWSSSRDGVMGTGKTLEYAFATPGSRTVTVTATYQVGGKIAHDTASITVYADNVKPEAHIDPPSPGPLGHGLTHWFSGSATDANLGGFWPWLPCNSLTWTAQKAGSPYILSPIGPKSCTPPFVFPSAGVWTITLQATDAYSLKSDPTFVQVTVL